MDPEKQQQLLTNQEILYLKDLKIHLIEHNQHLQKEPFQLLLECAGVDYNTVTLNK